MKSAPKNPDVQKEDDVAIITTYAYLDDGYGALVARRFEEQYALGIRKFLFDLSGTKLTSTLGVSILISILEELTASNGKMAFCNCNTVISTTLSIMGLKKYAKVYSSREKALAAMSLGNV
jgi:anti-anti-sigma factor